VNITTTSIITQGLYGGTVYDMIAASSGLHYVAEIPFYVSVVHNGSGGGSTTAGSNTGTELSINYTSRLFNTIENNDYIETIVMFDGNKKIIQHYLGNVKIAEFSLVCTDVDFDKRLYFTDVENSNDFMVDSKITIH
jgi:hypothetical protein